MSTFVMPPRSWSELITSEPRKHEAREYGLIVRLRDSMAGGGGSATTARAIAAGTPDELALSATTSPVSRKLYEIARRVRQCLDLPADWDRQGAARVPRGVAERTVEFYSELPIQAIDLPSVVPCSDGSLQLEWNYEHAYIAARFLASGESEFSLEIGDEEDECELESGRSLSDEFRRRLAGVLKAAALVP